MCTATLLTLPTPHTYVASDAAHVRGQRGCAPPPFSHFQPPTPMWPLMLHAYEVTVDLHRHPSHTSNPPPTHTWLQTLHAYEANVDVCRPGDRVAITGILRAMPIRINPLQRSLHSLFKASVGSTQCGHVGRTCVDGRTSWRVHRWLAGV
eukprot:363427-Chlamydomonas_euryale.AAC.8